MEFYEISNSRFVGCKAPNWYFSIEIRIIQEQSLQLHSGYNPEETKAKPSETNIIEGYYIEEI